MYILNSVYNGKVCVRHLPTYPFDDSHFEVEYFEEWCDNPDVDDGDESKDEGPNQGHGNGDEGRGDPVEPQLGLAKQDERQTPDRLETLGGLRLSKNVVEPKLKKGIKILSCCPPLSNSAQCSCP